MKLKKTVISSMFLALGMVLPLVTAQIKEIGDTLLPTHLPVLLCGFLCGPVYGTVRILLRANVIYVSNMDDETVEAMHMIPAHSIDEALKKAKKLIGKETADIVAIPDGIAVMVV